MKKLILVIFLGFIAFGVKAQINDFKSSKTQFMIRGYGHMGYENVDINGDRESTYDGGAFAPIFLFKHSDRLMVEAELEFVINEGSLEVGFEYANIMYILNDYMTIRGGKFLLPFGTFMERLHPSWVNRMPTKPLGFGHDGIAPGSGVGVELRGAFRVGTSTINYSVYNTNGPRVKTPDGLEPGEAGMLAFNNLIDNNNSRAFGGRLGILPFANNSTEFGVSFYTTDKAGDTGSIYENLGANLFALDFSFVKQLAGLGGIVDIKSQYNKSKVDNMIYTVEETPGEFESLNFDNNSNSFYAQLSYRPTMSGSDFISKLEFVTRYSTLRTPEGAGWEANKKEYSFGLNYWISWRSLIKLNYQSITGEGGHDTIGGFDQKGLYLHWAIGL